MTMSARTTAPTAPAAPPSIHNSNSKRTGWEAFFAGLGREDCPFPPAREDLKRDYLFGWDEAYHSGLAPLSPGAEAPIPVKDRYPLVPADIGLEEGAEVF